MKRLHLYYEDGFDNDSVVVQVDGQEVARKAGLKSSLVTALAASEDVDVEASSPATIRVSVTTRDLSEAIALDLGAQPHLAIAVRDGKLVLRASGEPFFYL
ncbi:hypothetical protein BURC_00686 [Burkholderiaceae bacterium]|nr:hypothetical protein BURC_00686 [Burkholderiaceae bacterium]